MASIPDASPEQAVRQSHKPMVLSDNEQTRQFINVVCKDTDLLLISDKVQKRVHEVGKCLGLEEGEVEEIEQQDCNKTMKLYSAFMAWSEKYQTEDRVCTWGELTRCLATSHEYEILEMVVDFLVTCPPRIEDEHLQLHRNSFSVQETELGASGPSNIALEPRFIDTEPCHLQVKKNLRELEGKFNDVLVEAQKALESLPTEKIGEIHVRLASLCVDIADNIPLFDERMLDLITKFRISEIFVLMLRMKVWDPLNYRILTQLLKKVVPVCIEVHDHFEQYSVHVEQFKRTTLMRDYMAIHGSRVHYPHGYTTFTVKYEGPSYRDYTLARFAADKAFLAHEFLLHQEVLHFKESQHGCISVTMFVPKRALCLLQPPFINEKRAALEARGIVELIIDEKFIYRFPCPVEPPRPLSLAVTKDDTPDYQSMYDESIKHPDKFWGTQANIFLTWLKPFEAVSDCVMEKGVVKWFTGGKLNVTINCLDRHAAKDEKKIALIWEKNRRQGEKHGTHEHVTYGQLLEMTCRLANVLKTHCGVKKGDKVIIYMPTCPMTVAAMLACARIGAVHCVLYSVLGVSDLMIRIKASKAVAAITATKAVVGDKVLMLKKTLDDAITNLDYSGEQTINHVLVALGTDVDIKSVDSGRDIYLERVMESVSSSCDPCAMDSEDPLFIMYTSGTTGEPTGIVHTQAGYLLYAAITHKYVFDYKEGDVFACVSVLGWIMGHTYVVYGPLCNGATTVLFEGTATYPDSGRYWEMVERLKVNHFYTTPSAIKKLMKDTPQCMKSYDLSSLKTIACGGEPLSTAAWKWFYETVGGKTCALIDTYGQTELCGIVLSPQPGQVDGKLKPGVCTRPFFGVEPVITDQNGIILPSKAVQGLLCLKNAIPGMGRGIVDENDDFNTRYFQKFPGLYFTGDWAYRDIDGDYQIVGRQDDIIRIKGVWIQVPEIESSIARNSEKIANVSYIRLEKNFTDSRDNETCVVIELRQTVADSDEPKPYQEIVDCVKGPIIHSAGASALPKFVLLVKQNIQTWSEKTCRKIWRDYVRDIYQPCVKKMKISIDHKNMITVLDLCQSKLPRYADSQWLQVGPSLLAAH